MKHNNITKVEILEAVKTIKKNSRPCPSDEEFLSILKDAARKFYKNEDGWEEKFKRDMGVLEEIMEKPHL